MPANDMPTFCHLHFCKHHPEQGGVGAGLVEVSCYSERERRYVGIGGARVKTDCGDYERIPMPELEASDGDD